MVERAVVVGSEGLDFPGGSEAACRAVVGALQDSGFDASYVSASRVLKEWLSAKKLAGLMTMPLRNAWWSVAAVLTVARKVMRDPPGIVVTNGPLGWGIRGRSLSAHYYHGTYVGQARAIRHSISRHGYLKLRYVDGMLLEQMAGHGKTCVACSEAIAREVKQCFGHTSEVVWYPIDVRYFRPGPTDPALLERFGVSADRPAALFVGAGRPMKGEQTAYEVIRRVPEVQWVVIGDGDAVPPGVNARCACPVPPAEMPSLLRSVDVVLVTSWYDPFPFLVPEALAAGTPVVGSSGAGSADFLLRSPPLDCWFVKDPHDVGAYVAAVQNVLRDLNWARSLALEGRRRVAEFMAPEIWRRRFLRAIGLT